MKTIITFLTAILSLTYLHAQQNNTLTKGAALLFQGVKTTLSAAEQNQVFDSLGIELSADKKHFIIEEDKDNPFDAITTAEDLNKDGKDEIFIVYGNSFLGGNAGSVIALFVKNKEGNYRRNLGFPASGYAVLTTTHLGYADVSFDLPGMKIPIWKWNGKAYEYFKSVDAQ